MRSEITHTVNWEIFITRNFCVKNFHKNILTRIFYNMTFVRYYYSATGFRAARADKERQA